MCVLIIKAKKCNTIFVVPCSDIFFDGYQRKQVTRKGNTTSIGQLSLFKEGVQPEWEDPAHAKGMYLEIRLKGIFSLVRRKNYLKLLGCLFEIRFVLEGVFTAGTRKRWAHFSLVTMRKGRLPSQHGQDRVRINQYTCNAQAKRASNT